jgi:hypothetical protein
VEYLLPCFDGDRLEEQEMVGKIAKATPAGRAGKERRGRNLGETLEKSSMSVTCDRLWGIGCQGGGSHISGLMQCTRIVDYNN